VSGRVLPFRRLRPDIASWRNFLATFEVRCQPCKAVSFVTLLVHAPPDALRCPACGIVAAEEEARLMPTPAELLEEANRPENR